MPLRSKVTSGKLYRWIATSANLPASKLSRAAAAFMAHPDGDRKVNWNFHIMGNELWISILIAALAALLALVWKSTRAGIIAVVEKSVSARFDRELEILRSDLRGKEAKIGALQSAALSGRAGRQAILDMRRVEALEAVWADVITLNAFLWPTRMMEILKVDAIAEGIGTEPNLQRFVETIGGGDLTEKLKDLSAERLRIFLPREVWTVFSTYQGLLIFCYMRIKGSSAGMGAKMFKEDKILNEIKAVLPHFADYLDQWGVAGAAGLASNLRDLVFEALQVTVKNISSDPNEIDELHDIMSRVRALGDA
jgi:hypothetical protein